MKSTLEKADNALLIVVVAVVAFLALGVLGAIFHTILFAIKIIIVIAAIGAGVRVYNVVSGGAKRRELNR